MMGLTVALETATSSCSVAVAGPDGTLLAEIISPRGPAHTRRLLPDLHHALEIAAGSADEIETVVVGLGPGTFTGLRIGVATARSLAQAAGARLLGVSSLSALAVRLAEGDAGECADRFVALIDGKRREVFAATYRRCPRPDATGEEGEAVAAPRLTASDPLSVVGAEELEEYLLERSGALVGGDGAHLYADRLPHCVRLSALVRAPTASMVLRAWRAGAPGVVDGPEKTVPVYGRRPDAARWTGRDGAGAGGVS